MKAIEVNFNSREISWPVTTARLLVVRVPRRIVDDGLTLKVKRRPCPLRSRSVLLCVERRAVIFHIFEIHSEIGRKIVRINTKYKNGKPSIMKLNHVAR